MPQGFRNPPVCWNLTYRASILVVLLLAGCASLPGSESPTLPSRVAAPGAATAENVRIFIRPWMRLTESGEVDFGAVPAGRFMHHMQFMDAKYLGTLILANGRVTPLRIAGIEVRGVRSAEPGTPFSRCDVEFQPRALAPGKYLAMHICFNPTREGSSSAVVTVRAEDGSALASVTVNGRGRLLAPLEMPPMGLIAPPGHFEAMDMGRRQHVEMRDGALIDTESGKDVTPEAREGDDQRRVPERREPACTVEITGGGEIPNPRVVALSSTSTINTGNLGFDQGVKGDEINVGQHVILDISIKCPDGSKPRPTGVLWTIRGDAIRDYDETLRSGTVTTTALQPADLRVTPRDFYWRNTGEHVVDARVDFTWNAQAVTAVVRRKLVVERNDSDIDRQMEDFYVWNHKAKVLTTHVAWHEANHSGTCRSAGGEDFFIFHRLVLGSANGFRSTFGYPAIVYWDGTQALPVSPDSLHAGRTAAGNIPFPTPTYYTFRGEEESVCINVEKLNEFPSGQALAREMEAEWHGLGHVLVGGDMGNPSTSPKDPIFYRWHRAIDIVYYNWQRSRTP